MDNFKKNIYRTSNVYSECPMALVNDIGTFSVGGVRTISVLANDGTITNPVVTIVANPANGTAIVNVNNSITYTHNGGAATSDSLTYQVTNGFCTSTATVTYFLATTPPTFYNIHLSNSTPISNCSGAGVTTYPLSLYISSFPIIVGNTIYNESALTSTFNGDGTWYSYSSTFSMRINSSGIVTEIDNSCAPPE
jgi:hypothetical protein